MNQNVLSQVLEFLRRKMLSRRWQRAVTCLAAVAVFGVTYALILPAITMTRPHPEITAEQLTAWNGDELTLHVSAEAAADDKDKVFVLSMDEAGADLAEKYVFNEDGVTLITAKDDAENEIELELHRAVRENTKKDQVIVDYWFTLEAGTKAEFDLDLLDEVNEARFSEVADRLKRLASEEKAAAASASDAVKTADATASNAKKGETAGKVSSDNATASNAASSQTASGSNADEVQIVVEKDDDGFEQILDGAIINDLEQEEEEDVQFEISAVAKISAGSGDDLEKAKKDADMGADKRENGQLKFQWKTETTPAPEMVWSENGANIAVFYDEDAEIPGDAVLDVREILEGTEEYEAFLIQTKAAFANAPESDATKGVSAARFFDITIRDAAGNEIEPAAPVKVVITYDEPMVKTEDGNVNVLHFKDDAPEMVKLNNGEETDAGALSFTTDSFSVYALFGVETLTTQFLSANGNTYKVTVNYSPEANIPATARLAVKELTQEMPEYQKALDILKGKETASQNEAAVTENASNGFTVSLAVPDEKSYSLLLDISIVDGTKELEPAVPVTVNVELVNLPQNLPAEEVATGLKVEHLLESENKTSVEPVELIKAQATEEQTVRTEFLVESFSVYNFSYGTGTVSDENKPKIHYGYLTGDVNENMTAEEFNAVFVEFGNGNNVTCVNGDGFDPDILDAAGNTSSVVNKLVNDSYLNIQFDFQGTDGEGVTEKYRYAQTVARVGQYKNGAFNVSNHLTTDVVPMLVKHSGKYYPAKNNMSASTLYRVTDYPVEIKKEANAKYTSDIYIIYEKEDPNTPAGKSDVVIDDIETLPQPEVKKEVVYNDDGTATLSLSITGSEMEAEQHGRADFIVIFDRSGSMAQKPKGQDKTRMQMAKEALTEFADTLLRGSNPDIKMGLVSFAAFGEIHEFSDGLLTHEYDEFVEHINALDEVEGDSTTDWELALRLANQIPVRPNADTYVLFFTDGDPTVRISRGDYKHNTKNAWWTRKDSNSSWRIVNEFPNHDRSYLDFITASHFSHAEAGIFGYGSNDAWTQQEALNGTFSNVLIDHCFEQAKDEASDFYAGQTGTNQKHFYSVFAFGAAEGSLSRIQTITSLANTGTEGSDIGANHTFVVNSEDALDKAFADVIRSMTGYIGFTNVVIGDEITEFTNLDGKKGGDTNFEYTRTYIPEGATDPVTVSFLPEELGIAPAVYADGSIKWAMGDGFAPADGETYTVSCTLWPDQNAYDTAAAYANGDSTTLPGYMHEPAAGSNTLTQDTNGQDVWTAYTRSTVRGSLIVPKKIFLPPENHPVNHDDYIKEGLEDLPVVRNTTVTQDPVNDLNVMPMAVSVEKSWSNILDPGDYSFVIDLIKDGAKTDKTFTITGSGQSGSGSSPALNVACGMIWHTGDQNDPVRILENGHAYTLEEEDHKWDFSADEFRMMAIGHSETTPKSFEPSVLRKVDKPSGMGDNIYYKSGNDVYYLIDGKVYKVVGTASATITADNQRRSNLNLTKQVVSPDGTDISDPTFKLQDFDFKITITAADGKDVYFSVMDESGQFVRNDSGTNATPEEKEGKWTGYYYAGSGAEITVKLRPHQNLRFTNLPKGSTYTITEVLQDPFKFNSAVCDKNDSGFTVDTTTTEGQGTITNNNTSYTVTYKNECQTRNVTMFKTKEDGTTPLTGAKFSLYTKEAFEADPQGNPLQTDLTDNGDGYISLGDLAVGEYKIVETFAPEGYVCFETAVTLEIDAGVSYEQTGNILSRDPGAELIYIEDDDGVWVKVDGDEYVAYDPEQHAGQQRYSQTYRITVTNTKGVELPHTGGPGTTLYTLSGMMLLIASALLYGFRRRHEERRAA